MADDMIDIEEHDVLENPIIKQIFPDLSILKKEIIDYNDGIQDELLKSKTVHTDVTDKKVHRNSNSSNSDKFWNKRSLLNNKVILGNLGDKNVVPKKGRIKRDLFYDVKISLRNIRPKLTRSQKFCQKCLILFSKKEDLYNHQILCHSDHRKDQKSSVKCSIKKQRNSEIFRKHYINNTNEGITPKKISDINVMVNINDSIITDKNLSKPCFHCNILFPSHQTLIDHLYEILYNKNSNIQHIENRMNKDVVMPKNDKFLINASSAQVTNLDQVEIEYSQTNTLYRCPICSYYFNVKKFCIRHISSRHSVTKKIYLQCVKFCSKCKFCDSNNNDVLSYNRHLRKCHRNEMVKNDKESISKKIINDVRVMALKAILFKCSKCNIHFLTSEAAKNHLEHSEFLQNWYCMNCHKLFKHENKSLHEKQHNYSKYFTVVEVNNKSLDAAYLREENSLNHQSNCETEEFEIDDRICDTQMEHNEQPSQHKEQLKRHSNSDYSIIDTEKTNTNKEFTDIKEKNGSNILMKKYKQLYFCNVCKCNILKNYCNVKHHLQSRCRQFIKKVCDYCGLVFSSKTIDLHIRMHHKNSNIQLQDFIIIDLKTKTKIKPVFDLPKCTSCEKYFICKDEIVQHICDGGSSVTCPVCNIKLTESAFKLHEPFHSYNLQKQTEFKNKSDNLMLWNTASRLTEVINDDQTSSSSSCLKSGCDDEVFYLYTCKNCDISMNFYDDAIEHCHSHTHLNKLEIDTTKCTICNVNLISLTYNRHQQLHDTYSKETFEYFHFDVSYFNSCNDEWLDHVFDALPKNSINKIIEKSIYKYENKIKMEIIQDGPYELTMYKCDRCQSFIDSKSTYDHVANCKVNSVKFYCKMCNIPFISNMTRLEHENIHINLKNTLNSYRIVIFNREEDKVINRNVSKTKHYVLFECRYCHVVVDKNTYNKHECNFYACKNCNICGLLVQERHYDMHVLKHRTINSFNKNVMKVVLIGNKTINKNEVTNKLISTFSGMVCDYTFYKCAVCEVCIREFRNTYQHYCLIDAAKTKCPQCDLIFDEGKIKGHLKLHDTDPDITKDTIIVKNFGSKEINKREYRKIMDIKKEPNQNDDQEHEIMVLDADIDDRVKDKDDGTCVPEITAKIYKCYCGLHFINETQIKEHLDKCSGIVRFNQSRQDCFKCGLTFNSNILFKHLLEHHGGKNVFKYEIVENIDKSVT
ncbi:unnamed protein product [Euphydryas editha]|uniref:C2H2-type domain-containing protein n=1 Tax=Euphydryas editha TaxID=104508 RepID=A0AAU9UKY7_EUPED|nr:unnamed protein product [Euphydryas editha]